MAKHEFGLMAEAPATGQRFDDYKPEKYRCMAVDDRQVERLAREAAQLPMYWHTTDCPGKGFAYTGITLIPPETLPKLREAANRCGGMAELSALLRRAERENKWVIHYGM